MKLIKAFLVSMPALLFLGCATAPKQTIELADVVSQQIAQMQVSHEKFVHLYYEGLRRDVDRFMEEKWTVQFLSNVIGGAGPGGKQFRADLDRAYKIANLDWKNVVKIQGVDDAELLKAAQASIDQLATQEKGRLGQILIDFSAAAQEQIDKKRKALLQPIDEQEAFVVDRLREGYAQLQASSASIKAYLASVATISEKRDEVLQQLGVLDAQKKMLATAEEINGQAFSALISSATADGGVGEFLAKLKSLQDTLKQAAK
jgi:hypothetical protein